MGMRLYSAKGRGRRTVVIATLGPACMDFKTIRAMIESGMDVARLNFSHGDPDSHAKHIRTLRLAAASLGRHVPILADLPGPKVRIGEVRGGAVSLAAGARVFLSLKPALGTAARLSVEFPPLPKALKRGGLVFINDGLVQLRADKVGRDGAWCTVLAGGEVRSRKGFALPGARIPLNPPTARDLELLRFGIGQGVDSFGVSFAGAAADMRAVRAAAGPARVGLVAKLERPEALERAAAIAAASDGIMIARGDLGVNLPLEQVPLAQKALTTLGNRRRCFTITATQMMQSLAAALRPTRAEVADVANAVLDGTEAVMLSDETAAGVDPVNAVAWMARTAQAAERAKGPGGSVRYRLG